MSRELSKAAPWGAAGVALALVGQLALVYGLYDGDWSALFYTGADVEPPAAVAGEDPRRAPDPVGFDGQYYHFIAHDPLILADTQAFVDNPSLRWRRILVPGLAYVLGMGRAGAVDAAYIAIVLASTFLGVLWLSRYSIGHGLPAGTGLAFLLLPATTISLERMTVDAALAALCVGFVLLVERRPAPRLLTFHLLLALAPLARETGVACACAWAIVQLVRRRFAAAALALATLTPFVLWSLYVRLQTSSDATVWFGGVPLSGLVARTLTPFPTPTPTLGLKLAAGLEFLAVIGAWVAVVFVARRLLRDPRDPLAVGCALLVALFAFLAKEDIWLEVYGFGRTLSPVLLWLGMTAIRDRRWGRLAPWALIAPRVIYQAGLLAAAALKGG